MKILPADYEECGYCGFDHAYEPVESAAWHKTHDDPPEIVAIYNAWVRYEEASHVIVAWKNKGLGMGGGIQATARDEFTAHRYAAVFRKHGYEDVAVKVNETETFKVVHETICGLWG